MKPELQEQVDQELERARKALRAAELLLSEELHEDCVSRAYYAILHAARAALLAVSVFPDSHTAVKRLFGLHLVKNGPIEKRFAVILAAGQEDREMGDYGIGLTFPRERAHSRLCEAGAFLKRMEAFLVGGGDAGE